MASQTLYQRLVEKVESGAKFRISFEKKELDINGHNVLRMKEGYSTPFIIERESRRDWKIKAIDNPLFLGVRKADDTESALAVINDLYENYKHSRPSERSDNNSAHAYFEALPESELSTDDMLYGIPREVARFRLEYHVLVYSMLGLLKWDDDIMGGKWFYKSPIDPDLIILRSWID